VDRDHHAHHEHEQQRAGKPELDLGEGVAGQGSDHGSHENRRGAHDDAVEEVDIELGRKDPPVVAEEELTGEAQ
jgi:hypothetical protein